MDVVKKWQTEGPFGIKCMYQQAAAYDDIIKSLDSDCKNLISSGPMRKSFGLLEKSSIVDNDDERSEVSLVTSDTLDRDYEIIDPNGISWVQYEKNPVVVFAHDYNSIPVGKSPYRKRVKSDAGFNSQVNGWLAKTIYHNSPDNPLAQQVWASVKAGFMPGKSIGFIPTSVSSPTKDEVMNNPAYRDANRVIRSAMIIEYSVVAVPCNPDAIVINAENVIEEVKLGLISAGVDIKDGFFECLEQYLVDSKSVLINDTKVLTQDMIDAVAVLAKRVDVKKAKLEKFTNSLPFIVREAVRLNNY